MTKNNNSTFVITAQADIKKAQTRSTEQKAKALLFIRDWLKADRAAMKAGSRAGITLDTLKAKTGYASQASLNNLLVTITVVKRRGGYIEFSETGRRVLGTYRSNNVIYLKVRKPRENKKSDSE